MSYGAPPEPTTLVTTEILANTEILPILMMVSAVLTAPVSLFLLWLYQRAVLQSMSIQAGIASPAPTANAMSMNDAPALQVRLIDAATVRDTQAPIYRHALRSLLRATTV